MQYTSRIEICYRIVIVIKVSPFIGLLFLLRFPIDVLIVLIEIKTNLSKFTFNIIVNESDKKLYNILLQTSAFRT